MEQMTVKHWAQALVMNELFKGQDLPRCTHHQHLLEGVPGRDTILHAGREDPKQNPTIEVILINH